MKQSTIIKAALMSAALIQVITAADFTKHVGYAGNVTGGAGGKEVTVTSASAFKSAVGGSGKTIIKVAGKISGASVSIGSDKTIIGVGTKGEITKSTLSIKGGKNIIIRNLKIHQPNKGADLITITGGSNIWIDHCEIFSAKGDLNGDGKVDLKGDIKGGDVDWYDGLIDMTKGCNNITISWNVIHDSFKAMLVGSSDGDTHDRKLTLHHNYFYNLWERVPSFRGGTGHSFNNYYKDIEHSAVNLRMGAKMLVEGCVFDKVGSAELDKNTKLEWGPIGAYYSKTKGMWDVKDNIFIDCKGNQPKTSTCSFNPPYEYKEQLHKASETKTIILAWAGVGKYDTPFPTSTGISINNRIAELRRVNSGSTNATRYNFRGQKIDQKRGALLAASGIMIIKDQYGVRASLKELH